MNITPESSEARKVVLPFRRQERAQINVLLQMCVVVRPSKHFVSLGSLLMVVRLCFNGQPAHAPLVDSRQEMALKKLDGHTNELGRSKYLEGTFSVKTFV